MDWENHLEKVQSKKSKNSKNQSEIAAKTVKTKVKLPNKKITSDKANFCSNTVFSLYIKFRAKKSSRKNTCFFAPLPVSA